MLVEFSVNNFKSIKDSVTFSMLSGRSKEGIIKYNDKMNLLSCAAIFGANASGKTTILDAITMMKRIVLNTDKIFLSADELPYNPFKLSTETENTSTSFDIVFIQNGRQYKYGFEYDKNKIYNEYLFEYKSVKPTCVFDTEKENTLNKDAYPELKNIKSKPENYLYLWLCDQNENEPAKVVLDFFKSMIITSGISNARNASLSAYLLNNKATKELINKYMRKADFGIDDIRINKDVSDDKIEIDDIIVSHKKYDSKDELTDSVDFHMNNDESYGTYKFFSSLFPILFALAQGGVILYDELDASLHPLLLRKLFELFTDKELNSKNAQLIITCQDVSLIDYLKTNVSRISFTQKDDYGRTLFHSLDEYTGLELKKKLQDLYLLGSFDAIPRLEGFGEKI